jgi:hypothetical protein
LRGLPQHHVWSSFPALERDDVRFARHHALGSWWSMIFSENRCTLFGIML